MWRQPENRAKKSLLLTFIVFAVGPLLIHQVRFTAAVQQTINSVGNQARDDIGNQIEKYAEHEAANSPELHDFKADIFDFDKGRTDYEHDGDESDPLFGDHQHREGGNDCMLKAFSGNVEIENICEMEYGLPECANLTLLHNLDINALPPGLASQAVDFESPKRITVEGILYDYEKSGLFKPGFRLIWEAPSSESARHNIIGFSLVWDISSENNDSRTNCRMLKLNKTNPLYSSPDLVFRYDIDDDIAKQIVSVKLASVPSTTFVQKKFLAGDAIHYTSSPSEWTTTIIADAFENGSIQVRFTYPPNIFHFSSIRVDLVMKGADLDLEAGSINLSSKSFSMEDPVGYALFTGLSEDLYQAVVTPIDQYPDTKNCECWKKVNAVQTCELACESSFSLPIALAVAGETTTRSASATVQTEKPIVRSTETIAAQKTPDEGIVGGKLAVIVMAVLLSISAIAAAIVAVLVK